MKKTEQPFTIRTVNLSELGAIQALDARCFIDSEPYTLVILRQYYDLSAKYFLVAETHAEKGLIIGYALAARTSDPNIAWFLSIATDPSMRGHGVATKLASDLKKRLFDDHITKILVSTHPTNAPILSMCKKLGFEIIGTEDEYFGPGQPRVVLQRLR